MKPHKDLTETALAVTNRILDGTLPTSRDPKGLKSFLASNSPVRASIEVSCPACWLIETQDGERYGFTLKQVIADFGSVWALHAELAKRSAVALPAGSQNKES